MWRGEQYPHLRTAFSTALTHHAPALCAQVLVLHLMRFEHLRGAASKINKPVAFEAALRLRRPLLGEDSPDCRGSAEYRLVATVSHHGRNAAGEDGWGLAWVARLG